MFVRLLADPLCPTRAAPVIPALYPLQRPRSVLQPSPMRQLARLTAVALTLAACGDATGGGDPPPTPPNPPAKNPVISAVSLTANGVAVVTGTDLDALTGSLTVDGQSVSASSRTATEIRFTLPQLRACETDGRPVPVAIGSLTHTAPLDVPGAIEMAPGQSRVLTREEMDACMELAAAPGVYVLTALHPGTARPATNPGAVDTLLEVRTWTYTGAPSASVASASIAPRYNASLAAHMATHHVSTANGPFSDNPQQFDPRYATAGAGDTVPFVDFSKTWCNTAPSAAVTYPVRILATHGKSVVALDLRLADNAQLLTPEALGLFQKLAARVDSVLIPSARMIFGPEYEPTRGFGGRYVMLLDIQTIQSQGGVIGPIQKTHCALSSEDMIGTFGIRSGFTVSESTIATLASYFLHEYGHSADVIMGKRIDPRDGFGSSDFVSEGYAEQMVETGARLLDGRLIGTNYQTITLRVGAQFTHYAFHGGNPTHSPFTGEGRYAQGSSMLLYARELTGEAFTPSPTRTLHQQLLPAGKWDLATIAPLVGKTPEQFMDEWSLALATEGLTPTGSPLPSFRSWDMVPPIIPNRWSRLIAVRHTLATGVGNYAALYFGDDPREAGQGVSLQFSRVSPIAFRARLTRVR